MFKKITIYFKEVFTILDKDVLFIPYLIFTFLIISFIDLMGLSLIIPYINLILESEPKSKFWIFEKIDFYFSFINKNNQFHLYGAIIVVIFAVKAFVALTLNYFLIKFSQNQQVRLRTKLMDTFQNLPYKQFLYRNSSEYIHSIQILSGHFQASLYQLLKFTSDSILVFSILLFLIYKDFASVLIFILLVGSVICFYQIIFQKKIKTYGMKQNIAAHNLLKAVNEGIHGFKQLRILACSKMFLTLVNDNALKFSYNNRRYQILNQLPRYIFEVVIILFIVVLISLSVLLNTERNDLLSIIGLFAVASIRLLPLVSAITNSLSSMVHNRHSLKLLYNDIKRYNLQPIINPDLNDLSIDKLNSLSLENVSFKYDSNQTNFILNDLAFELKKGDVVGLIGDSGSGKTTLVDILLGLLVPQRGCIKYNSKDFNSCISSWQSQVAYLPQETFLIDASVKANIVLSLEDKQYDEDLLLESLDKAKMLQFVDGLPDGLNTIIGERGIRLSGGQRQRVALARAFYHKKDVLILDESTSALDSDTEGEIINQLFNLKGDVTMIMIAHRISTLRFCDKIYKLRNGKLYLHR